MKVRPPKVVLYSHDTMGLGHMRRNVLVARALAESRLAAVPLMITGAPEAVDVCRAGHVSCIALPPLAKSADGSYTSRTLQVGLDDLITLRGRTIRAALEAFEPDVLIVDNVPRGARRELDDALMYLRGLEHARCVLGLRDVLDTPLTVRREWDAARNLEAIREFFDEVWIYGDPAVFDGVREYAFPPSVANRTHYLGYLDQRSRLASTEDARSESAPRLELPPGRLALCLVGGGQDGAELAEAFALATLPPDMSGVIVTGPYMPSAVRARLRAAAADTRRLRVLEFVQEPLRLLARAERVVAMGGYNSVCEILSLAKPALIVPRVRPRREQAIRAERLHALGFVDVLNADALTPGRVSEWLANDVSFPDGSRSVDLRGLDRLVDRVERLLAPAVIVRRDRAASMGAGYGA